MAALVEGAIHVTNSQDVDFNHILAHQLRIHASVDLHFRDNSSVQSGVILEDSHGITFHQTLPSETRWEVKDFGWFQRGRPSPNYTILSVSCGADNEQLSQLVGRSPEPFSTADPALEPATIASSSENESDSQEVDDDEL